MRLRSQLLSKSASIGGVATKPSGHAGQCQELMVVGEKEVFVRGIHTYTGGGQRSRCRNVVVRADSKLGELRGW